VYQISSRTGWRHNVDAEMPGNKAAVQMLSGRDLPTCRRGKQLRPVNFYDGDDTTAHPAYRCSRCFRD
jgi:hypothetical protein